MPNIFGSHFDEICIKDVWRCTLRKTYPQKRNARRAERIKRNPATACVGPLATGRYGPGAVVVEGCAATGVRTNSPHRTASMQSTSTSDLNIWGSFTLQIDSAFAFYIAHGVARLANSLPCDTHSAHMCAELKHRCGPQCLCQRAELAPQNLGNSMESQIQTVFRYGLFQYSQSIVWDAQAGHWASRAAFRCVATGGEGTCEGHLSHSSVVFKQLGWLKFFRLGGLGTSLLDWRMNSSVVSLSWILENSIEFHSWILENLFSSSTSNRNEYHNHWSLVFITLFNIDESFCWIRIRNPGIPENSPIMNRVMIT